MSTKISVKHSLNLLGNSIALPFKSPQILYPFGILAFIQVFLMEIIFFATRMPLVKIFGPIIERLRGPIFLHYPFNFDLLANIFQAFQPFVFIFISSIIIGKAVVIVVQLNEGKGVDQMPKLGLKTCVNLMVAFLMIYIIASGFVAGYDLLIRRAVRIRSTAGFYFLIKQAVLIGAPYFNLLFSIIITTLLAYLVPLIVLAKQNIFIALWTNFKMIGKSFFMLLIIIFISSLFYVPVLLIQSNQQWLGSFLSIEGWQIFKIFSVLLLLFIDAIQYTAITTCYLLTKEE